MGNPALTAACLHRFRFQTALACLLACVWTVALSVEGSAQDHAGDKQALVALYNATDGPNWANNENWLSEEPLENWYGVSVSDGRVTRLFLAGNQLTGAIPAELGNLSNLTGLILSSNRRYLPETRTFEGGLTGTIPAELGDLANLTDLNINSNQLTGAIPPELGDLANLMRLFLSNDNTR